MYRFRGIDKLLGREELENQEIYFSDIESLNDPLEGIMDIIWQGDRIAWTNFFRNYLFCLKETFLIFGVLPLEKRNNFFLIDLIDVKRNRKEIKDGVVPASV